MIVGLRNSIDVSLDLGLDDPAIMLYNAQQLLRRMRAAHGGGAKGGTWAGKNMESTTKQVAEEGQWDLLRLEDVRSGRASHGEPFQICRTGAAVVSTCRTKDR